MNPLAFFRLIPTKVWAFLAIILLVGTSLWWYGKTRYQQGVSDNEAAHAEAVNKALLKRVDENTKLAEAHAKELAAQKKGYTDEIALIKRRSGELSGNGLRVPKTICDGFTRAAEASGSKGSNDAIAGTVALPESVERDLRQLMEEADTAIAGCRQAQKFIRDNGFEEK